MLRFTFIAGYAILLMGLISVVAVKVIALGQNASWGESPLVDQARIIEAFLFDPLNSTWIITAILGFIAVWIVMLRKIAKKSPEWERGWVKTLSVGCSIMMSFFFFLAAVGMTAHYSTGVIQETAAKLGGMMSSPVIMEFSFLFISFILLLSYNIYKRKADGDDFVEMEIKDE
jgi:hypothetical protein|tara:strand:- start:104 stop:622 length:519 start_codon:yes stop_codon:yes gene_type:complete